MQNKLKLGLILASCFLLQACVTTYRPKPGPTATLLIDLPARIKPGTSIIAYDEDASVSKKMWSGGASLIYGMPPDTSLIDLFAQRQAVNSRIPITAERPFHFMVKYVPTNNYNLVCQIKVSFVPAKDKTYRLSGGLTAPTETNAGKGLLERMFGKEDLGGCYVKVARVEKDKLIPVRLEDRDR